MCSVLWDAPCITKLFEIHKLSGQTNLLFVLRVLGIPFATLILSSKTVCKQASKRKEIEKEKKFREHYLEHMEKKGSGIKIRIWKNGIKKGKRGVFSLSTFCFNFVLFPLFCSQQSIVHNPHGTCRWLLFPSLSLPPLFSHFFQSSFVARSKWKAGLPPQFRFLLLLFPGKQLRCSRFEFCAEGKFKKKMPRNGNNGAISLIQRKIK